MSTWTIVKHCLHQLGVGISALAGLMIGVAVGLMFGLNGNLAVIGGLVVGSGGICRIPAGRLALSGPDVANNGIPFLSATRQGI